MNIKPVDFMPIGAAKRLATLMDAINKPLTLEEKFCALHMKQVLKFELDEVALGSQLASFRAKQDVTLRSHAKAMGYSTAYVSDLEKGRRHWTVVLISRYLNALPAKVEFPEQKIRGCPDLS